MSAQKSEVGISGVLINPREALQTPPLRLEERADNPHFLPPCSLAEGEMLDFISQLPKLTRCRLELPFSSCPSYAQMNWLLFMQAEIYGVQDRVAMHARLKEDDFNLARASGARVLHVYGNGFKVIGGRVIGIDEWLNRLDKLSIQAHQNNLLGLRASMEQATQMNAEDLQLFVQGLGSIKHTKERVLTGLGLPDTNGCATPEQWEKIFRTCGKDIADTGLTLYIHLHNDGGRAEENAKTVLGLAPNYNIPTVLEVSPDRYWGERGPAGLKPTVSQLSQMSILRELPPVVHTLVTGSTWMDGEEYTLALRENIARRTDTAGVHTRDPDHYGTRSEHRIVAAGLYSFMGQGNILSAHNTLYERNSVDSLDERVIRAAALVGREIAAQTGHKPQADVLALAYLAQNYPEHVLRVAAGFGDPMTWVSRPQPDLTETLDHIEEVKYELFRN